MRAAAGLCRWGKDEVRESKLVFIGRNLDKAALEAGIMACKAPTQMRFKTGEISFITAGRCPAPTATERKLLLAAAASSS